MVYWYYASLQKKKSGFDSYIRCVDNNDELDERYAVETWEVKSPQRNMVKIADGTITLKELINLTDGIDPEKITIGIGFDVPDYVWLEINIKD